MRASRRASRFSTQRRQSAALSWGGRRSSWNTIEMPPSGTPRTLPASGVSSPAISRSSVVLPQPDRPVTQVRAPWGKVWVSPSSTTWPS